MYTAPKTWKPSEEVTPALLNVHLRDNMLALAPKAIVVQLGAAGAGVITSGIKLYVEIPASVRITGWTLVSTLSGSIVIDVWKGTYANFPPTGADTIAGIEKPTLANAQKAQDLTLSTWTTVITAGEVLAFKVDSAAAIQQVTLSLRGLPA